MNHKNNYHLENLPSEPFHPGTFIQDEMVARNINNSGLAKLLGVTRGHITNLFAGRKDITPELAMKLEVLWGIRAAVWLNLQYQYIIATTQLRLANAKKGRSRPETIIKAITEGKVA